VKISRSHFIGLHDAANKTDIQMSNYRSSKNYSDNDSSTEITAGRQDNDNWVMNFEIRTNSIKQIPIRKVLKSIVPTTRVQLLKDSVEHKPKIRSKKKFVERDCKELVLNIVTEKRCNSDVQTSEQLTDCEQPDSKLLCECMPNVKLKKNRFVQGNVIQLLRKSAINIPKIEFNKQLVQSDSEFLRNESKFIRGSFCNRLSNESTVSLPCIAYKKNTVTADISNTSMNIINMYD